MKVLALASYPIESAATRYRLYQFINPLAKHGISLTVRSFLNSRLFSSLYQRSKLPQNVMGLIGSMLGRFRDLVEASNADVVLIQREAIMFGPPITEWIMTKMMRRPMILDLDDATYIPYVSPTYGKWVSFFKWFSKTDSLINWSTLVICGNRTIADYVTEKGGSPVIIPTIVDTEQFKPDASSVKQPIPVIGWIGTHSTYPYLESILPVLQDLARNYPFKLKIVGSGKKHLSLAGVNVECLDWKLDREVENFQSFDIGLYPITIDNWSTGKSGFKAIQYMAVGIPYVATPVGACLDIGIPNITHFFASLPDEWYKALARLLSDETLRQRMGNSGRLHVLEHYTIDVHAQKMANALRSIYRQ
jgi:glycosyltransferase involved in cell wall biosynthesis